MFKNIGKRSFDWVSFTGLAIITVCMFLWLINMPIDAIIGWADMSGWVASGHDFANGNFLLSGWYGGTGTEYFPKRLLHGITALFSRNWHMSFVWAEFIILCTTFLGMCLVCKSLVKDKFNPLLFIGTIAIFIGGIGMPNLAWTNHLGVIGFMLFAIYLLYKPSLASADNPMKLKSFFIVIGIIALVSDNYFLLYFLAPYLIERTIAYIHTKKFDRRLLWVFAGLACRVLINALIKIAPHPEYAHQLKFTDKVDVFPKLQDLCFSIFDGFNGSIWGNSLFTYHTVYFIAILAMITVTLLLLRDKFSKKWMPQNKTRSADSGNLLNFLVISSILVIAASIFAMNVFLHERNIVPPRYLIGFYINGAILLAVCLHKFVKKQWMAQVFMAAALALSIWSSRGMFKDAERNIMYRNAASVIGNLSTECGYASSTFANNVNVYLNRRQLVNFEAFANNPERSKSCPANFIVQSVGRNWKTKDEGVFESILAQQILGEPKQVINFDAGAWSQTMGRGLVIYVYDYDISKRVVPIAAASLK